MSEDTLKKRLASARKGNRILQKALDEVVLMHIKLGTPSPSPDEYPALCAYLSGYARNRKQGTTK